MGIGRGLTHSKDARVRFSGPKGVGPANSGITCGWIQILYLVLALRNSAQESCCRSPAPFLGTEEASRRRNAAEKASEGDGWRQEDEEVQAVR